MAADVRIFDPDDLTDDERERAKSLLEAPAGEFDAAVRRYVDLPTDLMLHVLYSGDVAQETLAALGRLHSEATALERDQWAAGPDMRRMLHERTRLIATLRRELKPFVNLAVAAAADKGNRHRAERILGRARYPELRQIIRDLDGGMAEDAALAACQARMNGAGT
jgi:hypothetical protein